MLLLFLLLGGVGGLSSPDPRPVPCASAMFRSTRRDVFLLWRVPVEALGRVVDADGADATGRMFLEVECPPGHSLSWFFVCGGQRRRRCPLLFAVDLHRRAAALALATPKEEKFEKLLALES